MGTPGSAKQTWVLLLDELDESPERGLGVDEGNGRAAGVLSLEVIGRFLHTAPREARTGADLVDEADQEPVPGSEQ